MKLFMLVLALGLSISVNAGLMDKIKIKKAVAAAELKVQAEVASVKKACGNTSLSLDVNWDKWNSYNLDVSKHETTINYVASVIVNEVLTTMKDACKDADFKEVIGQIKKVDITGKEKFSEMYMAFSHDKGTLHVKVNGDGYGSWKNKELFLKSW